MAHSALIRDLDNVRKIERQWQVVLPGMRNEVAEQLQSQDHKNSA